MEQKININQQLNNYGTVNVIGYSVTPEYLEANPHLKFATGEDDTGVLISWNTEGKKSIEENADNVVVLPNGISINPLNWKLDDTYAPASENLGSLTPNRLSASLRVPMIYLSVDDARSFPKIGRNVFPSVHPNVSRR